MLGFLALHMQKMILIIDFGSQFTQLIARRVRELNVYCEIHPYNNLPSLENQVVGVILSGSPFSVNDADSPNPDLSEYLGNIPLLGILHFHLILHNILLQHQEMNVINY